MTKCDVCGGPAVMLVSSSDNARNGMGGDGMGGDASYGAIRSNRCDDHGRDLVVELQRRGAKYTVDRFAAPDAADREQRIIAEQALAETRVLLESPDMAARPKSFFETLQHFRELSRCTTCGKSTAVLNAARRGFRAERVTSETHCTCPGGPVDLQARGALNTLELAGSGGKD